MDSKKLIALVNESMAENWADSDIWKEGENLLEKLSAHLERCMLCSFGFDFCNYPESTLSDFSCRLYNTDLSDWICEQ